MNAKLECSNQLAFRRPPANYVTDINGMLIWIFILPQAPMLDPWHPDTSTLHLREKSFFLKNSLDLMFDMITRVKLTYVCSFPWPFCCPFAAYSSSLSLEVNYFFLFLSSLHFFVLFIYLYAIFPRAYLFFRRRFFVKFPKWPFHLTWYCRYILISLYEDFVEIFQLVF